MRDEPLPRGLRLAELARRQYGVVSIRQLRALGVSKQAVARAVAAGRLHRLHQGVYAVGHTNLSNHGRCLAAVLASGPEALLSHYSAAWLWGLATTRPVPVHVTAPTPRAARPRLRLHHSRTLIDEDRAVEDGIPVTSVPRMLLDMAVLLRPPRRLAAMLQRAERQKLLDRLAVESVLARNRGHRGCRPLRRALAIYRPSHFTRSGLEGRVRELVEGAGLPAPRSNYVEAGFELDLYWPELRFAVELDVFETHGSRRSFEEDRLRQEELKLAGIEMVRVTGARVDREPNEVVRRLGRLLEQRRRQLARAT